LLLFCIPAGSRSELKSTNIAGFFPLAEWDLGEEGVDEEESPAVMPPDGLTIIARYLITL